MRTAIIIILSTLVYSLVYGQQPYKRCKVYQYASQDSLTKTVTQWITYNANGKILTERYVNFWESAKVKYYDREFLYFYQDTLLIKKTSIDYNGDRNRVLYTYNRRGQLIKEVHYIYTKRTWQSGRERKHKSWFLWSKIHYKYDQQGRRIEYYAPKKHWDEQNRYTWKYNTVGQIIEYCSFKDDLLLWREKFTYFEKGYQLIRTWYDDDGVEKNKEHNRFSYIPLITQTYTLDDRGQVIMETVTEENNILFSRLTMDYDLYGNVKKKVLYDSNNKPEITHIYEYE